MKSLRINKAVAALAMLLFFTFGTATLAHEIEPVGTFAPSDLRDCLKRAPLQLDPNDVNVAVPFDTRHAPRGSCASLAGHKAMSVKVVASLRAPVPADPRAGKPHLHIYDSVLLL